MEKPHLDCVGPGELGVLVLHEEGVVVELVLVIEDGGITEDGLARLGAEP